MSTSIHEPQAGLQHRYHQLAELYDDALAVTSELPAAFHSGTHAEAELKRLAQIMAAVEDVEQQLAPLKRQWEAAGRPTSPELQTTIGRVQTLLEKLVATIAAAEEQAQVARAKLNPRLNTQTLGQRMRAAYAASENT